MQMKYVRKRFWVYVAGVLISIGMSAYGFWSISIFRSMVHLITVTVDAHIPYFHPVRFWSKVTNLYVRISGNWDPAAAAEVMKWCVFTMIFAGILFLILFVFLLVLELIRLNSPENPGNVNNLQ